MQEHTGVLRGRSYSGSIELLVDLGLGVCLGADVGLGLSLLFLVLGRAVFLGSETTRGFLLFRLLSIDATSLSSRTAIVDLASMLVPRVGGVV